MDGGGAAKPVTAVQDCVPTFITVTSMGIFKETFGQSPVVFMATNLDQNRYFEKRMIFP